PELLLSMSILESANTPGMKKLAEIINERNAIIGPGPLSLAFGHRQRNAIGVELAEHAAILGDRIRARRGYVDQLDDVAVGRAAGQRDRGPHLEDRPWIQPLHRILA